MLRNAPAGFGLVGRLAAVEAAHPGGAGLDPDERLDLVAGWDRLAGWVNARRHRAVLDFAGQESSRPAYLKPGTPEGRAELRDTRWEREHLALALNISQGTADRWVSNARRIHNDLPRTLDTLEIGALSPFQGQIVLNATSQLDQAQAAIVDEAAEAHANASMMEFRHAIEAAVIAAAPKDAVERRDAAQKMRNVWFRPLPDEMGKMSMVGPVADLYGLWRRLDTASRRAPRETIIDTELDPDGVRVPAPLPVPPYARAPWLEDASQPGPHPLDVARWAEEEARVSLGRARYDAFIAMITDAQIPDPIGAGRPEPVIEMQVAVSADTLLGHNDEPAYLRGVGPITADTARKWAFTAHWRRMITDPCTGVLLDRNPHSYRLADTMVGFVRDRDQTCRTPGCTTPTRCVQIDHIEPFDAGGRSLRINLDGKCGRHHLFKTHSNWIVIVHPNRTTTWTSPHARTYSRKPPEFIPLDLHPPPDYG